MKTLAIRDIGTILKVDKKGFIINLSHKDKIITPWSLIVDDIIEAYKKHIPNDVHSIYIKGSVGRGTPIPNISDIDCLTLLKSSVENSNLNWTDSLKKELELKYPFCTDFDLVNKNVNDILEGRNKIAPVLLKTMATCVYGEDVIPALPKVKPGNKSLICTWNYKKFIKNKTGLFSNTDNLQNVKSQCKWIMKRILRTGFELIMGREKCFTRDLYPCYRLFSKYYPEKEQEMKEVLILAVNNTNDQQRILGILRNIGIWITNEIERVYDMK